MNNVIACVLLGTVFVSAQPALAQKVASGYEPRSHLTELTTFAFVPAACEDVLHTCPENMPGLRATLTAALERLGLREDKEHPDFLVRYSTTEQFNENKYLVHATHTVPQNQIFSNPYRVGTLTVTFSNPNNGERLWHGTATETVFGGSLDNYFPKEAEKLVKAFRKDAQKQRKVQ